MSNMHYIAASVLIASSALAPDAHAHKEREIALKSLPPMVLEAAKQSVEGIHLTEAEEIRTKKSVFYEVEGVVGGVEYEILVTQDGEVLEVEEDD